MRIEEIRYVIYFKKNGNLFFKDYITNLKNIMRNFWIGLLYWKRIKMLKNRFL